MPHPAGAASWRIGCIGFAYDEWRGPFYAPDLPPAQRLRAYAESFSTVELDTTFYATPPPERFRAWAGAVSSEFRFALKAPQVVTHGEGPGHLAHPVTRGGLLRFLEAAGALGDRLGCVLLQFPATRHGQELEGLGRLTEGLEGVPLAVEFRHRSWVSDDVLSLLRSRGIGWVGADLAPVGEAARPPDGVDDRPRPGPYRPLPWADTAEFVYLRWNGRHAQYPHDDRELHDATPRLGWWLDWLGDALRPGRTVYGFCGNSFAGHGPATCRRLLTLLGRPINTPPQRSLFESG